MFGSKRFHVPVWAVGLAVLLFLFALLAAPAVVRADPADIIELDFEEFAAGDPVTNYIRSSVRVRIAATTGDPVAFDSAAPTCGDEDLGSPNQDFGGPGIGLGGGSGQIGENALPNSKVLVIQDPASQCVSDDIESGGAITFSFPDNLNVLIHSVSLLDIQDPDGAVVELLANDGTVLHTVTAANLGDNSFQQLNLSATYTNLVNRVRVTFVAGGAVASIRFEKPGPTAVTLQSLQTDVARPVLAWLLVALAVLTLPTAALLSRRTRTQSVSTD